MPQKKEDEDPGGGGSGVGKKEKFKTEKEAMMAVVVVVGCCKENQLKLSRSLFLTQQFSPSTTAPTAIIIIIVVVAVADTYSIYTLCQQTRSNSNSTPFFSPNGF